MADDQPFYAPGRKIPARQPVAGELLFEFVRPDRVRIRRELRNQGEFGVEAQFFRNEEFSYSRRFDTRALAVQWADQERQAQRGMDPALMNGRREGDS